MSGCTSSNNSTYTTDNTTNATASTPTNTSTVNDNTTTNTSNTATASTIYIGNSNTHKFHRESCRYVDKISSENKVTFTSKQEAIDAGYTPCQVCDP